MADSLSILAHDEIHVDFIFSEYEDQFITLFHVCVALVLGGAIGFERELKKRPAGFRTHMLVAATASLLTDLAMQLVIKADTLTQHELLNADPTRVMVAIVTGISFLGAGTIFRSEDGITGLTTAATLLFASTLGIAVALEKYLLSVCLTLLVLIVLRLLGAIGKRVGGA